MKRFWLQSSPVRLVMLLLLYACSGGSGPSEPEIPDPGHGGSVLGKTATYAGLTMAFLQAGDNWTSDNQFVEPDPGFRFYTVEVEYRNQSTLQRTFNPYDFELGVTTNHRFDPVPSWRDPELGSGNLAPGQIVRGWVTFEIPANAIVSRLYWSPRFDVTLTIPI